jgi:hypothetical protein
MSVTRPRRRRLPARVYWFRRALVLGIAFALVLGISRLLGGGSDSSAEPSASPAAAESPTVSPTALSTADATARAAAGQPAQGKKRTRAPLPMPSGPCQDSDVKVVPAMAGNAYAGGTVRLTLRLTTFASPACDWAVSPDTVAVKVTSGSDRVWSSQDCPAAVPKQPVVLRKRQPTFVDVLWSGRRSDPDCSRATGWAEPGYYHVAAAALGSEPEDQQFRLLPPAPVTITPTPTPTPKSRREASSSPSGTPSGRPAARSTARSTATPSADH